MNHVECCLVLSLHCDFSLLLKKQYKFLQALSSVNHYPSFLSYKKLKHGPNQKDFCSAYIFCPRLLCKFKNGVLWFCESTNNVFWVTNNSVSWLFRLSRASPTMDGSGDAHEWFDEKQKVEERTLWYIPTFSSTSLARNLIWLAQSSCHAIRRRICKIARLWIIADNHALMLRFALLLLYYTRRLWAPFIGLGGFGQYRGCGVLCCDPIALWTMHRY